MPTLAVISFSADAISSAWSRLSSAHGPAMSASGSELPKRVLPTVTTAAAGGSTFIIGATMKGYNRLVNGSNASARLEYESGAHGTFGRDHDGVQVGRMGDIARRQNLDERAAVA